MARREPTRRRPAPSRLPRRTVLIVIGADRTETAYLKGLRAHFGLATVTMKIVEKPGAPDQLVEHARDHFPLADFDGGLERASARARALDSSRNPSTTVWRLVDALLERE